MINSCKIHKNIWFHRLTTTKLSGFTMKSIAGKFKHYFIQSLEVFPFIDVYFGEKMSLTLYFNKFSREKPNLVKNCGFLQKLCHFQSKTTLYNKMKHVKPTKWTDFLKFFIIFVEKLNILFYMWEVVANCCIPCKHTIS